MMDEVVYRIRDESLMHASSYRTKFSSSYSKYEKARQHDLLQREKRAAAAAKKRGDSGKLSFVEKYRGPYKSPYYDPVARKERYEREKTHVTRPYGVGLSAAKSSGGGRKGSGGGKGGKGGKGGSGGGKGGAGKSTAQAFSDAIDQLKNESSLETDAQKEAAKRKIEDLKEELREQIELLSGNAGEEQEGVNVAEIRGRIAEIKEQITKAGYDLSDWVSTEQEALRKRISDLTGSAYDPNATANAQKAKEQQQEERNKEVNSRADVIYKRKKSK